ncbi:MAG: ABC transporter substrate-binding protein [Candidatus Bathyarchaeota archaeon]|nr:ABC transporter substrate-binding protein [Candidatus Termiticorpusculum sp.]
MNKKTIIATVFIALIVVVTFYVAYNIFYTSSPAPFSSDKQPSFTQPSTPSSPTNSANSPLAKKFSDSSGTTVTDAAGRTVTVPDKVLRIVSLNGALTELLCAMGCQDLIVGRTTDATFPPSILNVPVVGTDSYSPSVEKILELEPDIIISDSMIAYNTELYDLLTGEGIPIFIADTTEPQPAKNPAQMTSAELYAMETIVDYTCSLMQNLTDVVGHKEQVTAYVNWVQPYNTLVKDRVATLSREDQPTVFLDWYSYPYSTFVISGIYQGGGINIAENETSYSPTLSPEFVVEKNPAVIIELILSPTHNVDDFIAARNDVLGRPDFQGVDAVKDGRVYVCDFNARGGTRAVIGYLYFAKWLQPDLFVDVNPDVVSQQLNQQFFGVSSVGAYCYP